MTAKRSNNNPRPRPATTPEARDVQLVSYAYDHAEKKLLDGTASDGLAIHFLKMGAANASLAEQKIRNENLLLEAKVAQIESSGRMEELYTRAINALRGYQGLEAMPDDDI